MSSASEAAPSGSPRDGDEFRYGYRPIRRDLPGGRSDFEYLPLRLEDLLHPQWGDQPMNSLAHGRDVAYLFEVFKRQLTGAPGTVVLFDVQIVWDVAGLRHHSPDLAVIQGVARPADDYHSFDVAAEGVRPALIVEVVSPAYRVNDVTTKVQEYHRARVPLYAIVDRTTDDGLVTIIGYRYTRRRYVPLPLNEHGRLWLEPVRLWLGAAGDRAVCYDEAGAELGDYAAVSHALEEALERAAEAERLARDEAAARAALEARVAELEARLRAEQGRPDAPPP
jgi:colicin import membrane protein